MSWILFSFYFTLYLLLRTSAQLLQASIEYSRFSPLTSYASYTHVLAIENGQDPSPLNTLLSIPEDILYLGRNTVVQRTTYDTSPPVAAPSLQVPHFQTCPSQHPPDERLLTNLVTDRTNARLICFSSILVRHFQPTQYHAQWKMIDSFGPFWH